jgi:hypothetical protein
MDKIIDVDVDGIVTETEKAICVRHDRKMIWLPKSQVEYDANENVVTLPEWLAIEKELI